MFLLVFAFFDKYGETSFESQTDKYRAAMLAAEVSSRSACAVIDSSLVTALYSSRNAADSRLLRRPLAVKNPVPVSEPATAAGILCRMSGLGPSFQCSDK